MDTPVVGKVRDVHGVSDHSEVTPDRVKKVMFADESKQGLSLESVIFFEPYNHQAIDIESEKLGLRRSPTLSSLSILPETARSEDSLEFVQGARQGFSSRPKRAHQEMQQHTKSGLRRHEDCLVRPIARRLATQSIDFGPCSAEPVYDANDTATDTAPRAGVMGSVSMWYREHEDVFNSPVFSDPPASAEDRTRKKG